MENTTTKTNFIFILGGADLEMNEIEKVLVAKNQKFLKKSLGWGEAKLSAYKEDIDNLEQNIVLVPIELELDYIPTQKMMVIDHHNENSENPASIIQVLNLLGLYPTRFQTLVAENDVGHIRRMKEVALATSEEIQQVRLADRQAQGITQEQENMGVEALQNAKRVGSVLVVESKTSKFATICDRLEGKEKNLIVYCYQDRELNYYGENKNAVVENTKEFKNSYSGGDDNGYFGVWGYSEDEINKIRDRIISLIVK